MGLFSSQGKNKQGTAADDDGRFDGADDDALAAQARSKRASTAGEPAPARARTKAAADPILPEKKRARRRLVGAIALALAVAVGLPMVLDSEPKPLSSDIDIRIPSKEKPVPLAAASVPAADALDPGEEKIAEPAKAVAGGRDITELNVATAGPEPKTLPKAELKHAEQKPAAKAPPAAPEQPADKPAAKSVKAEEKPAGAQRAAETERALAILEGKPAEAAGQKFVVQVASLASQEKVDELRARLRDAGISSFTQKVRTKEGELIRVRVGPSSKDEAERIRARLGKLGLGASVVPA